MKFAELREKLEALPRGPYEECRGAEERRACRCGQVWAVADDVCLLSTNTNSPDEGIEFFTTEQIGRHSETLAALLNALPELLQIVDAAEAYKVACKQADATWEDADINASRIAQENLFAALKLAAPDTEAESE